jgi:uncharacterized membrane protein
MNKKMWFVAKRTDGLGERLRSMLNAIALSSIYDAEFKFCWDDLKFNEAGHAIDNKKNIFSSKFIEKYHIEPTELPDCKPVENYFQSKEDDCYICDQTIARSLFVKNPDEYSVFQKKLTNAFSFIEFSDMINNAIQNANEVKFDKEYVALHLRAGDLIYGNYKYCLGYAIKAISYPIALKIIEDARDACQNVLVFGQDTDLIDMLVEKQDVISANSNSPEGLGRVEAAFFDIVLMSRCSKIYGGASGFAILASMISAVDYVRPHTKFSFHELALNIVDRLDLLVGVPEVSSEQVSYACKSALVFGHDVLDDTQYNNVIEHGNTNDPDNVLYDFIYAWRAYLKCDYEKAESLMMQLLLVKETEFKAFIKINSLTPSLISSLLKIFDPKVIEKHVNLPATSKIYNMLSMLDKN